MPKKLYFLNSPTAARRHGKQGRSDAAATLRRKIKKCGSQSELLSLVRSAVNDGTLEASVIGAAMQTCGNRGWWAELMEIRKIQKEQCVELFPIQRGIALTALTLCLKKGHRFRVVESRAQMALALAKEL